MPLSGPRGHLLALLPLLLAAALLAPAPARAASSDVPIVLKRGCRNICYRVRSKAFHDCRARSRPVAGCEIRRCVFSPTRRTLGYICADVTTSTTPLPTPTPTPTPTPGRTGRRGCRNRCYRAKSKAFHQCRRNGGPTPGCVLRRCEFSSTRKTPGWICADADADETPSSSPSSSPSPSVSPADDTTSPSPSPSPSPGTEGESPSPTPSPLDGSFESLTFGKGVRESADRVEPAPDGSDTLFRVAYDVVLTERGVVSLDAVASALSISCDPADATISIQFDDSAVGHGSLEEMYPVGSLLAFSGALFPDCRIAPEGTPEEETEEEREIREASTSAHLFRDIFMYIDAVSGTPRDAVIKGTPTTYFALFDSATISIVPIAPNATDAVRLARRRADAGAVAHFDMPGVVSRALKAELSVSQGPISMTTTVSGAFDVGFVSFEARFGNFNPTIELKVRTFWEIAYEVKYELKGSVPLFRKTRPFIDWPLYGVPSISFFKGIAGLQIPTFKLGIYFEAPLVFKGKVELAYRLPITSGLKYTSPVSERTYYLRDFDVGMDETIVTPGKIDPTTPSLSQITEDTEASIGLFGGIVPTLSVYAPLLNVRVGLDVGAAVALKFTPTGAFPPDTSPGVPKIGICDECHKVAVEVDLKAERPFLIAIVGIDVTIQLLWWEKRIDFKKVFRINDFGGLITVVLNIIKGCFVKEFEDGQEVCGPDKCCEEGVEVCATDPSDMTKKICTATPSPSPSPSPSPGSPSPSPSVSRTPSPSPTPDDGCESSVYTDPHLRTFDGLSYDCQALGEFVMVTSDLGKLDIHALFVGPNTRGTVTKGIAMKTGNVPIVQVSVAFTDNENAEDVGGCPVLMYVGGSARNVSDGTGITQVVVSEDSGRIIMRINNGVYVSFRTRRSSSFGCYFEFMNTFLPRAFVEFGDIRGLLGSPNNNPFDDWMKPGGELVPVPETSEGRLFETAYNYCTSNWCIKQKGKSLFTHETGNSFEDLNKCDLAYGAPPNFAAASSELVNLCGQDVACLVDGLAGDLSDARTALRVQAEVQAVVGASTSLRFSPSAVEAETTVNVRVLMDISRETAAVRSSVERFAVYRVNGGSGARIGPSVLALRDDGRAVTADDAAGDGVFSNVLAVRASEAGEAFHFEAAPVISGTEEADSPLARTVLNAVRAYSAASRVGTVGTSGDVVTLGSLVGLELVVRYSWPTDQSDLDTATAFLSQVVGFGCSGAPETYISFSGDDTSSGGTETIVVQLDRARADGAWSESTSVVMRAGWYSGGGGSGPATLGVVLRVAATQEEIGTTVLSGAIDPGSQSGCASTVVAVLNVTVAEEVSMQLTIS